ncbi:Metallo-dependent phosphatase-like protein [Diplogelasinospora grovesii]|uniref:Metallo-dependent phosphatase-like protein n=1 Tax=Diplogelasinospora grovesii TaxID=303347 RepID=A0AAN6N466_9PEZI|nr:Metallo-dependent phosphatase-like protein [Diplogelasinospora grovesii]
MTIRILILSDTHDRTFPDPATLPRVDVVLHCGDLSMTGTALDAQLKLVIAGDHDVSLDPKCLGDEDDDQNDPVQQVRSLFNAEEINGLHFLDEGMHSFKLDGDRSFTVYASPYTPESDESAWSHLYLAGENPFGDGAESPMPSNGVDIVMTHGPPLVPSGAAEYRLDINKDGLHCGCPKLFEAISRTKPKLHCFGHLHEGYGSQEISWHGEGEATLGEVRRQSQPLVCDDDGKTVLVNAAMVNHNYAEEEHRNPWVVDLNLN